MIKYQIHVTAKEIRHTQQGFVLVYDSLEEKRRDIARIQMDDEGITGLVIGDEITIDGRPLVLEVKQRLALDCFRCAKIVPEIEIAIAVYRNSAAPHNKIYRLVTRLSDRLRPYGYQIRYFKGYWQISPVDPIGKN